MTFNKVNYTTSRAKIKATFRYNAHRKGKDGEKITRPNFGWDGEIKKLDAYEMIDTAEKGTIFFRFKISPDPKKENPKKDLSLQDLTRTTMRQLKERLGIPLQFIAAEHDDHTAIPHIHAIVLLKGRLELKDLQFVQDTLTAEALTQRQARDLVRERGALKWLISQQLKPQEKEAKAKPKDNILCPNCKKWHTMELGFRCKSSELTLSQDGGLSL